MPTRNIVLTKYQASLVERLVTSGRYQNASEVLREGLRLIENRDAEEKVRREALRQAARAGIADFEAGRFRTFDSSEALVAKAQTFTGLKGKSSLVREALKALIERESARRLTRLGSSELNLKAPPRRRPTSSA